MTTSEELFFNARASNTNSSLLPLLDTDDYMKALVHVHRRHNPLIPLSLTQCSASNFVSTVSQEWDTLSLNQPDDFNIYDKRYMVIGAARRISSLALKMDREGLSSDNYILSAQRRGLLLHTRSIIPDPHTHAIALYNNSDAYNRLEVVECFSIISHLFASISPSNSEESRQNVEQSVYEPYVQPPPKHGRLIKPERRSCSSLAYTALHVRACKDNLSKGAFCLLEESKDDDSVIPFSREDFERQAGLNDDKNPLQIALSYLAGKLVEFKQLGMDVSTHLL